MSNGLRFLYHVCSFSSTSRRTFNIQLLRESRRVCTLSTGVGKTFRISFQAGPFFPFLSTSTSPRPTPRRNAERPPGTDLSNVTSGRPSPFYFTAGFLVSRIFIADRVVRVSFLPRVPHPFDPQDGLEHTYFSAFSPSTPAYRASIRRRPIKRRIRRYRHERIPTSTRKEWFCLYNYYILKN